MNTKKLALSTLFVAMLTIPTVLGAIPLKVLTPAGIVSTGASEAEARNRNTSANRPRTVQARNTGAVLVQRFSANRTSYTVNVRQSTNRANIRIGIREGQQHRWRIDTRNSHGIWRNGSYNSWRAKATRNINRDIRVNVSQGQERRLRVQIRDRSGNVRTVTINVRRAGGNTWGARLIARAGRYNERPLTFNRAFNRSIKEYDLRVPENSFVSVELHAAGVNTQMRVRINSDSRWTWFAPRQPGRPAGRGTTFHSGRDSIYRIQFQIRGAFNNMSHTPTHTRIYTVNIIR